MQAARRIPGVPLDEAARFLGVGAAHLSLLVRQGRLISDGQSIDRLSLEAYRQASRPPPGYLSAVQAALKLGISRDRIPELLRSRLIPGVIPNFAGGSWLPAAAVERLDLLDVARLGIRVPPVEGWLSSGEACQRLGCKRSSLAWMVASGQVEKMALSPMNTWYKEADVRRLMRDGA